MIRLLLLIGSVAVVAILAEVGLRFVPDTVLGFRYDAANAKFSYPREFKHRRSLNSLGFHDVEPSYASPDVTRVLLLGDSYVESYSAGPRRVLGQRLQHHLNERSGSRYDVVSLGKAGWGQQEQLDALREFGRSLAPDLVLTLFLPLNDVENNSKALRRRMQLQNTNPDLMLRPGLAERPAKGMPFFWVRSSVLNQLVSHRLASGLLRKWRHSSESIPVDYFVYAEELTDEWRDAWQETARLVTETKNLARQLGANYALASASTPQGVLGAEAGLEILLESYPAMQNSRFDLDLPDQRLHELCLDKAIPCKMLEPEFRLRTAEGEELHWQFDGHWNRKGIDFAGQLLADFLLSVGAPETEAVPDARQSLTPAGVTR